MSTIKPEVLHRLSEAQGQIWQTVSIAVSEATGQNISFGSPICSVAKISDLYSELSQAMMIIQFSFASHPEATQVVLIPPDTAVQLLSLITNDANAEIDENAVADLRGCLEGIVQGICLSVGMLRNETVVASGLLLRYQILSFPQNLQRAVEVVRTQVAVAGDDVVGSLMWLVDNETAHHILKLPLIEEEHIPFHTSASPAAFAPLGSMPMSDQSGLEILMDVPLEISVELGRVKMIVRDIVELTTGSIVEIDKAAGEPVDVMVNGRLVARGEVVVIEDNFGVRITEILNPNERLMGRLGEAA